MGISIQKKLFASCWSQPVERTMDSNPSFISNHRTEKDTFIEVPGILRNYDGDWKSHFDAWLSFSYILSLMSKRRCQHGHEMSSCMLKLLLFKLFSSNEVLKTVLGFHSDELGVGQSDHDQSIQL
ncbi:hypothetical protein CEXT_464881 [Caerostris extrusa]|uniref:Uncharacterized protein n=1 Tax=Caerostris extrusa TaxID=172846 RepID=A0AAV4Y5W1_CAEEX|nr:hypothetical protein CEXT_464881 [Caerostris extrusa]